MRRRTKREVSCSLTRPLRYDNISRAPGKHCQRSPEGMLPKLAAVSFVGDSSSVRKRRPRGEGGPEKDAASLFFFLPFPSPAPIPPPFLSFSPSPSFSHVSLVLARSRHKTRNTKQNRMLLGFCRAPPGKAPGVPLPRCPMILWPDSRRTARLLSTHREDSARTSCSSQEGRVMKAACSV